MTEMFYNRKTQTWLKVGLALFVIACFAVPSFSHAASAGDIVKTPLSELLKDNAGLHDFWKNMMALVNSFVVIILIAVAFCEILNININTYGVKKILPALVFSVLAANFSWIMCRLFIDWANIAMSRFSDSSTAIIDPLIASRESFTINVAATINSSQAGAKILGATSNTDISFFQAGMKTLFVWAGAIALYILTFLLLLRNTIIVALAVFSPIAFMAMVLPQTKSAFNKWWTTFVQWTFMPTVSVFMLWMGSKIQTMIGTNTDPLIGFLISIGFIYGAVKVPFSMSGAASGIMNKWADMGKKSAKFVGNAAYTYSGAKATVDYQKELMKTRTDVTKAKMANKLKDLTGIGSGLDIQKDKLARAQKRGKSVADKKVGEYISYRSKNAKEGQMTARQRRYAMEEAETMSNEGTTEYANKELMSMLAKRGKEGGALGDRIEKMRTGSQKAGLQMAAFDKNWSKFNDDIKNSIFKGSLKKDEVLKNVIETGKWKNGTKLTEAEMKDVKGKQLFLEQYTNSMLNADVSANDVKKSEDKLFQRVADERLGIDNAAAQLKASEDMVKALNEFNRLNALGTRTAEETRALEKNTNALRVNGYDISDATKRATITTDILNKQAAAQTVVDRKKLQLSEQFGKLDASGHRLEATKDDIPVYLRDKITFRADGKIDDLIAMSNDERKQVSKIVETKIMGDKASETESHGLTKRIAMLESGHINGDWTAEEAHNIAAGQPEKNDATSNRKFAGFYESITGEIRTGARIADGKSGQAAMAAIKHKYANGDGIKGLQEIAKSVNAKLGVDVLNADSMDADELHTNITHLFKGTADGQALLRGASLADDKQGISRGQTAVGDSLKDSDSEDRIGNRLSSNV